MLTSLTTKYQRRIANSRRVLTSAPMGKAFIPFAYVTALLGCWDNIDRFGTLNMGDVSVSVASTTLLGVFVYGFSLLSAAHAILH